MSNVLGEGNVQDDSYVSRSGQNESVPVQRDGTAVEDGIDARTADSDEQLGKFILSYSFIFIK